MKNSFSKIKYLQGDDYHNRQRSELHRRYMVLESKRNQLEHDLKTVKVLILSIHREMERYFTYEQLNSYQKTHG